MSEELKLKAQSMTTEEITQASADADARHTKSVEEVEITYEAVSDAEDDHRRAELEERRLGEVASVLSQELMRRRFATGFGGGFPALLAERYEWGLSAFGLDGRWYWVHGHFIVLLPADAPLDEFKFPTASKARASAVGWSEGGEPVSLDAEEELTIGAGGGARDCTRIAGVAYQSRYIALVYGYKGLTATRKDGVLVVRSEGRPVLFVMPVSEGRAGKEQPAAKPVDPA